ncbi:synaptotagmin-14-like [Scomber scombrus]|uniref:synaptotagmin-14-like n=1 Tax=Scomber scombrus TaxID=13677 RepID=UPI002DDB01E9|nr:synaptotagmin-14-like [Scomber scombrus]
MDVARCDFTRWFNIEAGLKPRVAFGTKTFRLAHNTGAGAGEKIPGGFQSLTPPLSTTIANYFRFDMAADICKSASCLFVWSDQCVIVCPLSLSLLLPVTPEAIGFLSAVGVFIVALAVLFLFINKKLCFSRVGGLPCLEPNSRRKKGRQGIRQGLVNSYGDDGATSSSDSEGEVLKKFEISVSRSQSFLKAGAAANGSEKQSQPTQLSSLGRRHKFTRLSDQEEGSTEPSDCEDMEAQKQQQHFQDPLSAAAAEAESAESSANCPNKPAGAKASLSGRLYQAPGRLYQAPGTVPHSV